MKNIKKRGLSPVIATILLIAIVIIIALIVFFWFRGMNEEAITKFDGQNIKMVCEDVKFEASYSDVDETIYIKNIGIVPIYKFKAKLSGVGSHETKIVGEDDPINIWPAEGLVQGQAYSGKLVLGSAKEIIIIPVLAGELDNEKKTHTCDEKHGLRIKV